MTGKHGGKRHGERETQGGWFHTGGRIQIVDWALCFVGDVMEMRLYENLGRIGKGRIGDSVSF